ncbi:MAG: RNA polymerase factor sigma-54 [Bacteroidales bacterium]|jgi:RNA polymerase sigma-54 factor|nr:RNA polymerase factor sigma-54 [Bacteroidales bacterium]
MISQKQEMQLQQKLSPRQILLMRLLQIPVASLEQRIEQELEENPALELTEDEEANNEEAAFDNDNEQDDYPSIESEGAEGKEEEANGEEFSNEPEINMDDYFADDYENFDYIPSASHANKDEEQLNRDSMYVSHESFQESLLAQLGMFDLSEEDEAIAVFLIGNIDESGYMSRSEKNMVNDLLFNMNISTTEERLNQLIVDVVQKFDPPGIGARTLQECLSIQLERAVDKDQPEVMLAKRIVDKYFNEFTKKHFERIRKGLSCSDSQFEAALARLLKLSPKPGSIFSSVEDINYIVPDFVVSVNEKTQQLELSLQGVNLPELRVGKMYQSLYKELQSKKAISNAERKEAMNFVKQKVNAARWFIEALSQREQTLYKTMDAIMNYQRDFFLSGDEMTLKPMVTKDIATEIEMDISTVSRVVRLKHVLTPYGVYPLKFFFSESMTKDDGEEVSSHEIKKIILDTVEAESKNEPFTDLELCNILNEKGYNIARRTVAKYREQLGIPVARLRK